MKREARQASGVVMGCALTLCASILVVGCKSVTPSPSMPASTTPTAATAQYPPRPTVPPPAFKVFHHDASSITLVTKDNASDAEIEAIIWQLRDAAQAHSFDKLGVPQKLVDARDPIVFFHIYRGSKCASEKYTSGALPAAPAITRPASSHSAASATTTAPTARCCKMRHTTRRSFYSGS
jgi:hypothetical protein